MDNSKWIISIYLIINAGFLVSRSWNCSNLNALTLLITKKKKVENSYNTNYSILIIILWSRINKKIINV